MSFTGPKWILVRAANNNSHAQVCRLAPDGFTVLYEGLLTTTLELGLEICQALNDREDLIRGMELQ